MTIHDKIASVVKPLLGKMLSTKQVRALVLERYPQTNPTSILPSDHSGPNLRSGRFYCQCSGKPSQIFVYEKGSYKVLDAAGTTSGHQSRSDTGTANPIAHARHPQDAIAIDDAFISEWDPKYDLTEDDEREYRRLVAVVGREVTSTGTISEKTFLGIWKWKGATRVIRHVRIQQYGTLYAPALRRAASATPAQKLATLLGPGVKLPGVDAATGSTLIHFIHPQIMPIMDVRTIKVLFRAGLISTEKKDLAHYEEFRRAIEGIKRRCPRWSLRQIDRALFAYHKQFLESAGKS